MERRIEPYLTRSARALRKRMTPAEVALWEHLRLRQAGGFKFRRQMPLLGYIVDFCCPRARVVIEVDGDSHARTVMADEERDARLRAQGYTVLRFTNLDVAESLEGVFDRIIEACTGSGTPSQPPPRQGE